MLGGLWTPSHHSGSASVR